MTRLGLTPRMRDCFEAIRDHLLRHGAAPSYEDLRVALGVKSKSVVHRLVVSLRERNWIVFYDHLARSISIIEPPPGHQLSPKVEAALHAWCAKHGETDPSAVVNDAVALFLDEAAGGIAA
ncbi:hypothetical protein AAFX91_36965 [Bradyrhizobium sp. 31Argb]|uniref:LexA family protein n=1 Tax=Bradyrhizobium sp. 31Argb TaxID=3141247 RepID=UPI00374872C8